MESYNPGKRWIISTRNNKKTIKMLQALGGSTSFSSLNMTLFFCSYDSKQYLRMPRQKINCDRSILEGEVNSFVKVWRESSWTRRTSLAIMEKGTYVFKPPPPIISLRCILRGAFLLRFTLWIFSMLLILNQEFSEVF